MKPPVKLDELMNEWIKDSKIDDTELGKESTKIGSLHSKYTTILSHHNLLVKKYNYDYLKLKKIKWEYYSGDLNNPDDLKKYGFEPLPKKILRQDVSIYMDSDDQLINLLLKKNIHEEIVEFCQVVLKEIGSRTYQLGNAIKWETLIAGH
jgi:hypothetical protein